MLKVKVKSGQRDIICFHDESCLTLTTSVVLRELPCKIFSHDFMKDIKVHLIVIFKTFLK